MIGESFSYTNAAHFAKLSQLAYEKDVNKFKNAIKPFGYKNVTYFDKDGAQCYGCLLYTSPSPRDATLSRMPSSA